MKNRNWFWGIFFILAAVFVIGSQMGAFGEIGFMTILATVVLISILIHSLFYLNFFGVLAPLAILYEFYHELVGLPDVSLWFLLLAAVLGSIGLSIIFHRASHRRWVNHHVKVHQGEAYKHHSKGVDVENIDDNNPYVKVSFGSYSKYLHADALKSGEFVASFGSLQVFFDQVTLDPAGAEVMVDCSFGEVELFIPRQWRVIDKLHASLGNIENHSHDNPAEGAPQIILRGKVSFGNVEIKYV